MEKMKIKLLNESQTYYQNNLNIFSNGLSLLAVNSLEAHGMIHQMHGQAEQINKLAKNIDAHSNFMKQKSQELIDKLESLSKEALTASEL